jgi:predicted glycoside hydrolase/deacetylase ChbG (UPF0249 family)
VKLLIVNADDFGYGRAVNRGIIECFEHGVLTSAGLMINTPGTEEAVRMARERPGLSLGLHVNFTNEAQRLVEFDEPEICRRALREQFARFVELVGRPPTHLDSHQHIHRRRPCLPSFLELAKEHGIPLRDQLPITYKGGFYAQWEYGVSDPSKVSLETLTRMLRNELRGGIYELGCHPGYYDPAETYVYHRDRELELATLCDPRLREVLAQEGIELMSYHQLDAALTRLGNGG